MSNPLRIALFSGNYNYQADGANKALNRLVNYLERQGLEVLVFSPTAKTGAFEPAGTLVSVPSLPIPGRGEYRVGFGLTPTVKRHLDAFSPTLIHLSAPDLLGHSALKYAERLGIPAVASFHTRFDTYFQYYKLGWLAPNCRQMMSRFYHRCHHVYAPSPSIGRVLQTDNIVGDNLRIWGRGIEREKFSPEHRSLEWRRSLGIDDSDTVLGFVGRLVKEKGLDIYADLMDRLTENIPSTKALIIGEGPEFDMLRKRLPDAIMTGHLSGPELSRAYASCDLFINPSQTETFGNVTLEAMASGVVPICLNATGSMDLVSSEQTGRLVDSLNLSDWVDATLPYCKDLELRHGTGQKAREASHHYSWNNIMAGLLENYREVLDMGQLRKFKLAS